MEKIMLRLPTGETIEQNAAEIEAFLKSLSVGIKSDFKKEFLKRELTHDEVHEMGKRVSQLSAEKTHLEAEKKAVVAGFAARITAAAAEIQELSVKVNQGYEFGNVQTLVVYNSPANGVKTAYRTDTWEKLDTRPITEEERQLSIL